ncbi:CoA-binding domain protein [Desulforamulus reducens MI-1]|uniref:CoA-binding domain protein n=1 Tax=Desulforamulus reducens (strain ATCC BAA-1160 / DSM 100696 / MI-1) TaxID=349161 RepID=A4J695_DESRM|nr:acetate--CoA ligase [Desulforamulus reducens]ABO50598.1 CoA-binding domain protein [Desulforamulus reducens MI-1]
MADLSPLFTVNSVAIIGASKKAGKVGNVLMKNVINSGFTGKIFPVNPNEYEIEGLTCFSTLSEIPNQIDLAVVCVPALNCPEVLEECGKHSIKNAVVISSYFSEIGPEGLQLEKRLVSICKKYGIHLLGPNCEGMMDTRIPLNASISPSFPKRGDIGFISQSGAMLLSIMDWSRTVSLGFSRVFSLGNKADVSETDLIKCLANDPLTKVILCYIEDVQKGKEFLEVASKATKKKPVIILKSGTSQAGTLAASSHTGALVGSDLAYETAFTQAGILRARTMTELFDLATCFSYQPLPQGDRVAIVTNAGGAGIVASDTIENTGLSMARFEKETLDNLRELLPTEANIYNPIDVVFDAKADRYAFALETILNDPNVDSVVILVCPTAAADPENIAGKIIELHNKHPDKPVFAAYMGGFALAEGVKMLTRAKIPTFTFPEPAIHSISGMVKYARHSDHETEGEEISYNDIDPNQVKAVFYDVIRDRRSVLLGSEAAVVAEAYGISTAPIKLAITPEEAISLADTMGYPVVLKIASPKIMHKSDVGGVRIGLNNADEVHSAFIDIIENVQRYLPSVIPHGIEVSKMMPKGTELIVGMTRDVQFGPLIAFGLGGIYVNLLKDVSFRLAKGITHAEIASMIAETKASTLLRGFRGERPADLMSLIDMVARAAKLISDFDEISELEINPLFAYPDGYVALDIKITIDL